MNSDIIAAINDKIMSDHVLNVGYLKNSVLVQGIDVMITEGDVI
jgi:hypothetical protein